MNILVTGGAGFIGSFLVDELIKRKHKVVIYDVLDNQVHLGKIPYYLNKKAEFVRADIRDYKLLKKTILKYKIEVIYHLAAKVGVGQSQYQIKEYIDVNVGGTSNLLDIIVNNKTTVKKLIVASSMSTYGEGMYYCRKCNKEFQPDLRSKEQLDKCLWEVLCPECKTVVEAKPTTETAKQVCHSIYALSKKVQEEMCLIIGKTYNIPTVALRFFNVFGPRQSLSNPYTGVAAIFMSRIKNNKPPIIFEDGLQTRDFVYVTDVVQSCILALKSQADYKVYNVGCGKPVGILDVAKTIAKVYGKDIKPEIRNKYRKGDIRHCFADITKIKKELGFKPKISFEDGIKKLVLWAKTTEAKDFYEQAEKELQQKGLL
ncbi:MAG: GDP-mannose 4,6-dehydratase [Endomicrobia bacterium]|nr:GDP-mannose 4,6-dehydratase [Endomicrobiia bacterium]